VTLGFPNLRTTELLIPALERAGTDIIELGFPFSDPLADGPTIQFASERAIDLGVRLKDAFHLIQRLRRKGLKVPVLFFSYLNPILHYGVTQTARELHQSGFDGLIIPDLPLEEGRRWEPWFRRSDLSLAYLAAPTTRPDRIREIAKRSSGFVYYVSLRGVTGTRQAVPPDLIAKVRALKRVTKKPVLVGFGISTAEQVRSISEAADGVIVGSAIIERLKQKGERLRIRSVISLVSRLVASLNPGRFASNVIEGDRSKYGLRARRGRHREPRAARRGDLGA
jgi:tryptophan synthase alpha chain